MNSDVSHGDSVVASARCCGPADVHAPMLGLHVRDHEVAAAQHLGVEDVHGPVVGTAPGDEGPGVARGHALQDGALVHRHRLVLGPSDDAGPLGDSGTGSWGTFKPTVSHSPLS